MRPVRVFANSFARSCGDIIARMQRFTPTCLRDSQDRSSLEASPPDIDALLEENKRLRDLVIYLSTLVVKNVIDRK